MPGPYSFPRQERLTRRADYLHVYRTGKKRVGPAFVCYVARRDSQGRRFGCAVSRKVGKAVVRNRVRRYLREIYRTHRPELPENIDLILVARPAAAELDYHACRDAVRRLLEQGRVLSG